MAAQPEGKIAPEDGALSDAALESLSEKPLSLYVHIPFCAARCGYCDFNTYAAAELGAVPGVAQRAYLDALRTELDLAVKVLRDPPPLRSIFFGGGTPTLLQVGELAAIMDAIKQRFELTWDVEVTTEANPETLTPFGLDALRIAGFNRLSMGMQSAVLRILEILERKHTPGKVAEAIRWARSAGFGAINVDLIYGTPTETPQEWQKSLEAVSQLRPDHVSAYSLILEPGTKLANQVIRGVLPDINDDMQAEYYVMADDFLGSLAMRPYEVSNWAKPGQECRHNLAYWHSDNWWGIGAGAHSHIGGVRWWNVRHPSQYIERLQGGISPAQGREVLSEREKNIEHIMLSLRLSTGLELTQIPQSGQEYLQQLVDRGLGNVSQNRLLLTRSGRLVADGIARDLIAAGDVKS